MAIRRNRLALLLEHVLPKIKNLNYVICIRIRMLVELEDRPALPIRQCHLPLGSRIKMLGQIRLWIWTIISPPRYVLFGLPAVWDKDDKHNSTTELDTHTNVDIIGIQATVFHTGRTAKMRSFSDEVEELDSVPMVDAALAYDCPKTLNTYLLIVKNDLHILPMKHNLIPPFIMW